MAMRLAVLMSLCILVASAGECPRVAWMLRLLSWTARSGEDLCLDATFEGVLALDACHGGPNQQWYQQGELILNFAYQSKCLTRDIASSKFLLSNCDRDNLLQHFTVTSKNGSLFIWQDSVALSWGGQTALPLALTKTALRCINKKLKYREKTRGTLDKPLLEDGLDARLILVIVMLIMVSVAGLLVALFRDSRAIRLILSAVPPNIIETIEKVLAELTKKIKECRLELTKEMKEPRRELFKEMEASRLDQSKLEARIDQRLLDQLAALKANVDQLGNLPALIATMETEISGSVCEMDRCAASISAVTNSFGRSIQSVAEQLTELSKEMKESRKDQSKLVDHITACKSQVGQLKQLVSSACKKINTSHMDTYKTSDTSSSAGSLDSWIHIPGGEPCCYLPETYFQVRTADGDEILSPATKLIEGSQVKADDGTWVHVASPPEQHHRPVIKLQADQSFLVVSDDHRILVRGNQTALGQS